LNIGQQCSIISDTDHNENHYLRLDSSLHDCVRVMVFSKRSLRRKQQH